MSNPTKANVAKVLGIKLKRPEPELAQLNHNSGICSIQTLEQYLEKEPSTAEYLHQFVPEAHDVVDYLWSLFPFLHWVGRYNLQWLAGDLVAGITIGAVVVPQGMAYAILATLPAQFGLYSSFMGVLLYWLFATSKDITIGPVAVMSQVTASVLADAAVTLPHVAPHVVASALALMAGGIICFIGLIRFGWIVDMISLVSLAAFMTGSALNIAVGQVPTLMGNSGHLNTRDATYLVVLNFFRNIKFCTLDAALGLTALFLLYLIRSVCNYLARRYPRHKKLFFFLNTLRTVFTILLYTLVSWLVNMRHITKPSFKILGTVPRGFQNAAVPTVNKEIASQLSSWLPVVIIVLLIEHVAISKSFGRVNNYVINPSQEMVAIGVTNLLGPFLGAYPATGSFSRTAIQSKAGVRTPFAGFITAVVVLLAIYALPAVFFYIPNAALSAVIIHAVGDLITPPNVVYQFWRVSPFEVLIYFIGVVVTVFSSIENGIYSTISISAAMLLFRILKAKGRFLGRVKVHSLLEDRIVGDEDLGGKPPGEFGNFKLGGASEAPTRNVFLPLDHEDGSNPAVHLSDPYPGVFIYRFEEGFSYPNASHGLENFVQHIFKVTRKTNLRAWERPGDRPWNNPGPTPRQIKRAVAEGIDPGLIGETPDFPTLKAVILDFSSVNNLDVTSVQILLDVRNQLDRYASPDVVDWHFANVNKRWAKRALVSAGFGYPAERPDGGHTRWKSIFSLTDIGGSLSAVNRHSQEAVDEDAHGPQAQQRAVDTAKQDVEAASSSTTGSADADLDAKLAGQSGGPSTAGRFTTVHSLSRPLFHVDLTSALQSAILNVQAREEPSPGSREKSTGIATGIKLI